LTREEKLVLEVFHSDRLQKDQFIGKTQVPFADIIKFPIKKTKQSYVRIFDSFHSIDQTDDRGEPVGKLGELRVIIYLEDLGPSSLLAGRMEELVDVPSS
jgi:C2 domain